MPEVFSFLMLGFALFAAGFVDSLAGGGGMITLPAYLAFGVPPQLVLGTNKVSSLMGTSVSVWKLHDKIRIEKTILIKMVLLAAVGAPLGAALSRLIPAAYFKYVLLLLLPPAAFFMFKNRHFGARSRARTPRPRAARRNRYLVSAGVSCYDGFLGPATGTFFAVLLTRFAGFDLLRATAAAKLLNLSSNLFSLLLFLSLGAVNLRLGLTMGLFNIAGNWCGAALGRKKGQKIIRPMIVLVCLLLAVKLLWDISAGEVTG